MWYLWAAKFGEYLLRGGHLDWRRETLSFRFYPVDDLEHTEATLTQRLPFLPESRSYLTLSTKPRWVPPRVIVSAAAAEPRTLTTPVPNETTSFLWGVEDFEDLPRYSGFVPLGLVIAERPDAYTAVVPVNDDGTLLSVEWGAVAFKRAGERAAVARMQMNKVEELHPGFDPETTLRRIERNPFGPSRSLSEVASGVIRLQPNPLGRVRGAIR